MCTDKGRIIFSAPQLFGCGLLSRDYVFWLKLTLVLWWQGEKSSGTARLICSWDFELWRTELCF